MSPSGVTRLIAALEERLGARLLQRTTRSLTLTDTGSRYLERARQILSGCRGGRKRCRGRAHQAGRPARRYPPRTVLAGCTSALLMTAYLNQAIPTSSADLRLSDRMINLVEEGVDLAVRIGHLPDLTLVARHVGEMRRIVVASKDYLKRRGEPKTPGGDRDPRVIRFRCHDRCTGLALCRRRP